MSFITVPHTPGPYGLLLDIQEPLLACLSLLLLAVGFYLVWPGIALCYRQLRMSAGWLAAPVQRIQPAQPARTPGEGASAARPVHLWSAPDHPRALGSRLARQVKLASRYLLHPAPDAAMAGFLEPDRHPCGPGGSHAAPAAQDLPALPVTAPAPAATAGDPDQPLRLRHPPWPGPAGTASVAAADSDRTVPRQVGPGLRGAPGRHQQPGP